MYYKYKVTWYSEYEDKELVEEGLVYASSYGAAARAVAEDYNYETVIDIYLFAACNDGNGECISKDEIDFLFSRKDK